MAFSDYTCYITGADRAIRTLERVLAARPADPPVAADTPAAGSVETPPTVDTAVKKVSYITYLFVCLFVSAVHFSPYLMGLSSMMLI